MRIFKIPEIFVQLFPQIYWKDRNATNQIFLTFDDGPDKYYTPKILDILQMQNAFATFFVLGHKAEKYIHLIYHIHQHGHTLGIHSYEHQRLFLQPKHYIYDQLNKSKHITERIIREPVRYFRPPYGTFSRRLSEVCRQLHLQLVMWTIMSYDFDTKLSDNFILKRIETKVTAGDIIVFHDGHAKSNRTIKILEPVIKILQDKGFQLISINK